MKPYTIVISINLAFFAIFGLFFTLVVNRPELIPLFTSIQGAFNLLGLGVFFLDRKKEIVKAFLLGLLMVVVVTVAGYLILQKYRYLIGLEENFTTEVQGMQSMPDRA